MIYMPEDLADTLRALAPVNLFTRTTTHSPPVSKPHYRYSWAVRQPIHVGFGRDTSLGRYQRGVAAFRQAYAWYGRG